MNGTTGLRPIRIGVLADTHIPKRAKEIPVEVLRALEGADAILHAGDLVAASVLERLASIAPTEAVAGNNDPPDLARALGFAKVLAYGPFRIGLVHGHLGPGRTTLERARGAFRGGASERVDAVVFGHSHMPYASPEGASVLAFNPGSPTDRRSAPRRSFGFLHLDPERRTIRAEHVFL